MSGSILNVVVKLTALLLAFLLWFNVITEKQYEHEVRLPVTSFEFPPNLGAVTALPDSLNVKVASEGKKLLRTDWKQAGLRVKGVRLRQGVNTLDLNLETVSLVRSDEVTLVELSDAAPLVIQLDRIDSTLKPVTSRLTVVARRGYTVVPDRVMILPRRMQIIGPRYLLDSIDSILTERKTVSGVAETVRAVLKLERPPGLNIRFGLDSVTVEVPVDKVRQKEFADIPITIKADGSGQRLTVDPDHVTIKVEGPAGLLDSLLSRKINVVVDASRETENGRIRPEVILPPAFTLVSVTPESVRFVPSP